MVLVDFSEPKDILILSRSQEYLWRGLFFLRGHRRRGCGIHLASLTFAFVERRGVVRGILLPR